MDFFFCFSLGMSSVKAGVYEVPSEGNGYGCDFSDVFFAVGVTHVEEVDFQISVAWQEGSAFFCFSLGMGSGKVGVYGVPSEGNGCGCDFSGDVFPVGLSCVEDLDFLTDVFGQDLGFFDLLVG